VTVLIVLAGLLLCLLFAWWMATRPRKPGRRPSGLMIAAAVMCGIGRVLDPPQERATEATRKRPSPDESGDPPLDD
jgi:hypothetical protein